MSPPAPPDCRAGQGRCLSPPLTQGFGKNFVNKSQAVCGSLCRVGHFVSAVGDVGIGRSAVSP